MTFADQPISEFLDDVASGQVTPSGGAVAAVGGAMGAALCEMVCIHTVGTDGSEAAADELSEVGDTLADRRERLLALADEDAATVDAVGAAIESGDDDRMQAASKRSTEVPLETAEVCLDVVEHARTVTAKGTPVAVPDAAVGALLAAAALQASVATVRANLDMIDDESFVAAMKQRADEAEAAGKAALDEAVANAER
ncbi:formimidoyltetrahydrofolate cyclodeaminase (plasmid) [Haloarcula hispanica N601]|uniref:Formimidoyltetrahydrofolate cyclodeaminase n=2 Tax=Haloarcula hispanica TaxID=51589 RepID=V5TUC8_HALHI|nr:cyclodeaminase/cyclohydrolase family protein [Haloarcula hispanica]AEM59319.1 formimidoyltetrahydrofolate cyclodeaminase [Haloarcula hispanica ATCC 33960]AHB68174.1 formimidoyltetrahydrofolate cyclodeaminase [Haloarcula hispanica N601]